MKKRQLKKNLKKAALLLNSLYITEYDWDGEGILYINVEDTEFAIKTLKKICNLVNVNSQKMFKEIKDWQKEFGNDSEPQIDLVYLTSYLPTPKKSELFFHDNKGFSIGRTPMVSQ